MSVVAPGPAQLVHAATNVTVYSAAVNLEDEGPAECAAAGEFCTLIGALEYAEQLMAGGEDVDITFDPSLWGQLFSGVGTFDPAYFHATVPAGRVLTISGPDNAEPPVIDGMTANRLFAFSGGGTVHLRNLQLQDGAADNGPGDSGGAIMTTETSSTLMLTNVSISGSRSEGDGGAVYASGSVALTDVSINLVPFIGFNVWATGGNGGAVHAGGSVTMNQVTINGTNAAGSGGAVYALGSVAMTDVSIVGSPGSNPFFATGGDGGAVYGGLSVVGERVTIDGSNAAGIGGAIFGMDSVILLDSTITNTIGESGGGAIALPSSTSSLTLASSTISFASNGGGGGTGGAILCTGCQSVAVTDGSVISNSNGRNGGGAIHAIAGLVVIEDSTIRDNSSFIEDGGGILADALSTVTVVNSTLTGNVGQTSGGAIACEGCSGVEITDSVISQNTSGPQGGGIYVATGSGPLTIVDSELSQNTASINGGGVLYQGSTLAIRGSRLVSNAASLTGGGVAARGAVAIESSVFQGNHGGTAGGGLYCNGCTNVTVSSSAFVGNTANGFSGVGGGADFGINSSVQIVDTTFSANAALTTGQALNLRGQLPGLSSATLDHVTIADHAGNAAALSIDPATTPTLRMTNSVIAGNERNCDLPLGTLPDGGGTPNVIALDEAGLVCPYTNSTVVSTDPGLQPLAQLGGTYFAAGEPIPIHGFDGNSVANNLTSCSPGQLDGRGVARSTVACDVGAFELDINVVTEGGGLQEAPTPAALVRMADVPASALTPPSGNGSDNSQALTTAQVRGIDLETSPLRNIPLRNIGLTASDVDSSVLASISLAQVPLDYPGGWTGYLTAAGLTDLAAQPLNTVNLLQVLTATEGLSEDKQLDLGQLDLSKTVLGSLPVGAVALAGAALDDLAGSVAVDWCALIVQYTDRPCDPVGTPAPGSDPIYTSSATLVSLSLEGIPLRNIPLRNIPLRNIDLNSAPLRNIPLRNIPLRNIDLSVSPLRNIPLRNIPLRNITLEDDDGATYDLGALVATPLRNIPLRNIDLSASPLRNIPLRNIELAGSPLRNIPLRNIPLRNIDVAASPLRNIPLRNIDLAVSPLRNIPLRNIPLRNIDVAVSPLRNIPLRNIDLAVSPLRNIPLRNISTIGQLVDCAVVDCSATGTATIDTAVAAQALLPAATLGRLADGVDVATDLGVLGQIMFTEGDPYILGDIADAFALDGALTLAALADVLIGDLAGTYTLADLVNLNTNDPALDLDLEALLFGALTIHDLLDILLADPQAYGIDLAAAEGIREGIENLLVDDLIALLAELEPMVTLADLFLGVIEPGEYPWDELDLAVAADGLRATSNPAGVPFAVQVSATVPLDALELEIDLPAGFTYVPGSVSLPLGATIIGEPTLSPGTNGSTLLQTRVSMPSTDPGTVSRLGISVLPPLEVGSTDQVTATVNAPAWLMGATSKEGYLLHDVLESNDQPLASPPEGPTLLDDPADTLVVSYIREAGDVDWFRLAVPQGQELSFNLSNLPADYDMLLFGPGQTTSLRGEPSRSLVPAADNGLSLLGESVAVAQIGADVDTAPPAGYRFIQGSARRGTDVERIATGPLAAGQYLLKVSGYNDANAKRPYVLRTRIEGETAAQQCSAADHSGSPLSLGSAVTTIGADTDTLVLVDTARLAHAFPAPGASGTAAEVVAALETFTTALTGASPTQFGGTRAAVVDLAQVNDVQVAYDEWDEHPCNPELANGVVAAIGDHLDGILTPSIENLVIIGADDQIPMARLVDGTPAHNESEYAGTWNEANPVSASLALGYMLSDDPYSTASPIAIGARQLFVPELAVGRLVESPQDIATALTNFLGSNGLLDPETAISTGYDFLEDGARAVADELEDGLVADVDETLIATGVNAWTKADIVERFAVGGPDLASVNAHFDHYRALPADQDAQGRLSNPLTLSDVRDAPDDGGERPLEGSVIFSMGCHGGLSVSDIAVGTLDADWAQTLAGEGAAAFAGNTGYGYGDTAVVAFSEELMRLFAERLSQAPTIGSAMTAAKQRYVSDLAVISSFEEKVSSQVVFYGLPMYRIDGAESPALEPFETPTPDPMSGIPSVTTRLTPNAQPESTPSGTYYSVGGEVQATPYQPIQPRTSTDVTASGRVARGALITGLVSDDEPGLIDPVIVTPADDSTGTNAEARSQGAIFPSVVQSVSRVSDVGGERDRLVLVSGQFRGVPDDPSGRGVQRLFTTVDAQVFYAPTGNTDTTPPRIGSSRALVVNGQVAVNVEVPDDDVSRVLAMYVESDAPDPRTWKALELTSADRRSWVGTAPAAVGTTGIDYFIQVLDSGGNVSVSSDKGSNFTAAAAPDTDPDPGDPTLALDPPAPPNGTFYTASVTVTAAPADGGGAVTLVVNGVPSPSNPVVLTQSGVYTIEAVTAGRPPVTTVIVIDATGTPPQVSASVSPAPSPSTGWHTTKPVTVTMTGQAGSRPVAAIVYSLNNGPEQTVQGTAATLPLNADGDHNVWFRSVDTAGVSSPVGSVNLKIDTVPPVVVCPSAPTYLLNQPGAGFQATVSGATVSTVTLNAPTGVVGSRTATAPAVVDQAGNSTPVACPYNVRYRVEGFFEPITMNTVNKANAGKNIPVKWRLTDYNGQGISNVASFVSIALSPGGSGCSSQSIDEIETYTTLASSVPQYQNNGNWHLNWKTEKSLAGSCRIMTVQFNDGSRLIATFNFK